MASKSYGCTSWDRVKLVTGNKKLVCKSAFASFLPHDFSTQRVEKLLQKSRRIPSLLFSMFWVLKSAFALDHREKIIKKSSLLLLYYWCACTVGAELKCLYREMQLSWTIIELPFEVYNVSLYVCLFVFKTLLLYSLADFAKLLG